MICRCKKVIMGVALLLLWQCDRKDAGEFSCFVLSINRHLEGLLTKALFLVYFHQYPQRIIHSSKDIFLWQPKGIKRREKEGSIVYTCFTFIIIIILAYGKSRNYFPPRALHERVFYLFYFVIGTYLIFYQGGKRAFIGHMYLVLTPSPPPPIFKTSIVVHVG